MQDDGAPNLGEEPSAIDDIGIDRERFQEGAGEGSVSVVAVIFDRFESL